MYASVLTVGSKLLPCPTVSHSVGHNHTDYAMSMPVKLSDQLVLDARTAVEVTDRSITGQIEFWATLGKSLEQLLGFAEVAALKRRHQNQPLEALINEVGTQVGHGRLNAVLQSRPFPHYEPSGKPGVIVQIREDGSRVEGRFRKRQFVPLTEG